MAYFPLFVDLEGKEILVVGGGKIAARRAGILADFGCCITVIAPETGEEMEMVLKERDISYIKEEYKEEFLTEAVRKETPPFFVLAAASGEVNEKVVMDCRRKNIPVNDSSRKENCDFYFPGIVREKEAVIGVTSGGGDHKLAAALTKAVRTFIEETWRA